MTTPTSVCPVAWKNAPMAGDRTAGWNYIRSGGDVFLSEDGTWYLTSAEACRYAARHPELFSSTINASFANCPVEHIPASIDPPDHARYRRGIIHLGDARIQFTG